MRYHDSVMPRAEVDVLLELLDSAFQRPIPDDWSDGWHSLLSNLRSVREEDLDWLAPDGKRTIRRIAGHAGVCMLVYSGYGFGKGLVQWPNEYPADITGPKEQLVSWLCECHLTLHDAIAACTDSELDDKRETWDEGDFRPRRWFVTTMIDHLLYHAGEINYVRALAQKNDG
jgi:hypothetical protein